VRGGQEDGIAKSHGRALAVVYDDLDCRIFRLPPLWPSSGILTNTKFRKPNLFRSSGEWWETTFLLSPLDRASLGQRASL
jgi:hypothetical protein